MRARTRPTAATAPPPRPPTSPPAPARWPAGRGPWVRCRVRGRGGGPGVAHAVPFEGDDRGAEGGRARDAARDPAGLEGREAAVRGGQAATAGGGFVRTGGHRVEGDAQGGGTAQFGARRAAVVRGGGHKVYAEAVALAGDGLQSPYDRTGRRPSRRSQRGGEQRVQVVDDDDETGQRRARIRTFAGSRRAQPQGRTGGRVEVRGTGGGGGGGAGLRSRGGFGCALGDHPARHLAARVPLREAEPAQELGPPLQLGAEGLGELPHPYGVVGGEVGGDVGQVRTHPQPLGPLGGAVAPGAVPPVHQHDPEPVGALRGGQGRGDRAEQLRTTAAGRALDQQVRALGGEVHGDRAARAGAEDGSAAAAERLRVVRRVRPTGHE